MKKHTKLIKAVAAANVMALALSATACGSSSGSKKTVDSDSPWFDYAEVPVATRYAENKADYENIFYEFKASAAGSFVLEVDASKPYPDGATDDPDFDYSDYNEGYLQAYDYDGNMIGEIDAHNIMDGTDCFVNNVYCINDEYYANVTVYDNAAYESTDYLCTLDFANGEATDFEPVETDPELAELSLEKTYVACGKLVRDYWSSSDGGNCSYVITAEDPETGDVTTIDLRDQFSQLDIFSIDANVQVGDSKVYMIASSQDGNGDLHFMLDLNAGTAEQVTDTAWLADGGITSFYGIFSNAAGQTFCTTDSGLKQIDFEAKTVEDFFSYDYTYANRSDLANMAIITADSETGELVMCGEVSDYTTYTPDDGYATDFKVIKFTKAETNPNAGKTILTAATVTTTDAALSSAISEFNSTNENYFINMVDTYSITKFVNEDSGDDYDTTYNNATADMSNQLTMDIMSGVGPDIIINAASYAQLNTENYLVDLSTYLTDTSSYFGSIIDASKTDGHLYQMPLTFTVSGILTSTDNVSDGQTGFTFEQYPDFVNDVCNGTDPIDVLNSGKTTYFNTCFSAMYDQFVTDGTISLSNDAFTDLAEYVRDNVADVRSASDDEYQEEADAVAMATASNDAAYADLYSTYDYLNRVGSINGEVVGIYGIPSSDGRGATATINSSAAISATCSDKDGAWSFVSTLLSDTYQTMYSVNGNPISRSALDAASANAIEAYNNNVNNNFQFYTEAELASYGMPFKTLDDDALDPYINCIDSISYVKQTDSAIMGIISEEIPAFYEGQKSLDEVVSIIEDRAQTVINERA